MNGDEEIKEDKVDVFQVNGQKRYKNLSDDKEMKPIIAMDQSIIEKS